MNLSTLLYIGSLCYVALVFFRPGEVISGWADLHLVRWLSVAIAPLLIIAWRRRAALPVDLPHDRWLLGYWLAIGVSNLVAGWDQAVLGAAQFAQVVFFYFVLRTAITRPEQFRAVVLVLIAGMLFHAVGAIVQSQSGVGWGGVTQYVERTALRSRSVGIFHDPNDLALGFSLVLPFVIAGAAGRTPTPWQRVAAAAAAVPLLVAFYYTNSRGAMLGLAASICAYTWRRFGLAAAAGAAVLTLATLLTLGPSRATQLISPTEPSAQGRIQAWAAGLHMLESHPLTGVGFDRFPEHHVRAAHNSFVQPFAELGLLGGWAFIGIVYSFFWGHSLPWRTHARDLQGLTDWEHALTSAGAGFFVEAFFLSKQYNVMTFTLVGLGAVYLSIIHRERQVPVRPFGRQEWLSVAAAGTAMLLAIWLIVRLFVQPA